jgi:DNA-binding transcriptional LysR family regulator
VSSNLSGGERGESSFDEQLIPHEGHRIPLAESIASTSMVHLVAAEPGVSIVSASTMPVARQKRSVWRIAGQAPTVRLALAHRRGDTSPIVRDFVASAVS